MKDKKNLLNDDDKISHGRTYLPALLQMLVNESGSDLHVTPTVAPAIRIHGKVTFISNYDPMTPEQCEGFALFLMGGKETELYKRFTHQRQVDFAITILNGERFRVNVFYNTEGIGMVLRIIPQEIRTFEQLMLPKIVQELCDRPRGLVLVTGPTGSGKTTTLAAMIDKINRERHEHIITIEDPVEFIHRSKKCIVNQREVGTHTESFNSALKVALREDPDVVLVGEMRDLETIEAALRIAETGHLTFATLHTNTAASTINRVIDVFPAGQQKQIRTQLAETLIGVMCQTLIPKIDGKGRAMGLEILIPTNAVKNLIRDDKVHQIYASMQSDNESGSQTLNSSLFSLVKGGLISAEMALSKSQNKEELQDSINSWKNPNGSISDKSSGMLSKSNRPSFN